LDYIITIFFTTKDTAPPQSSFGARGKDFTKVLQKKIKPSITSLVR